MTAISEPHFPPMDFATLDDKMEMASSPYPQVEVEDLDVEFNQMENQTLAVTSDNLMDDASDIAKTADDIRGDAEIDLEEDQMIEEDTIPQIQHDLDMGEDGLQAEDDEILYDEDDTALADSTVDPEQTNAGGEEEELLDFDDTDHVDNQQSAEVEEPAALPTEDPRTQHLNEADPATSPQDREPAPRISHSEAAAEDQLDESSELVDYSEVQPSDAGLAQQDPISHENPTQDPPHETHTDAEPAESTDISVLGPHFATVKYNNFDYPLFGDQAVTDRPFPLTNTSLLFEPLDKLLEVCRQRISKYHEEHFDEVLLDAPALGLQYCEDSKYTAKRTLAEILQLYIKFHRNEGLQDVPPLQCSLSIRTCLATQYDWLLEEAGKQTTFTAIHNTHIRETEMPSDQAAALEIHAANVGDADDQHQFLNDVDEHQALEQDDQVAVAYNEGEGEPNSGEGYEVAHEDTAAGPPPQEAHEVSEGNVNLERDGAVDGLPDQAAPNEPETEDQLSEFFDDAFEDEEEVAAVEQTEEQLEQQEDDQAFQQAGESASLEDPAYVEEQEQLDFGDEPEPFKAVEEEHEIAAEEEDLFVEPDEVLEAKDDPDALVKGRIVEANPESGPEHFSEMARPVNGHHPVNGSSMAAPPATPSKNRTSKRKVEEEEDDLLEFDFDTPEPKRQKPSPT